MSSRRWVIGSVLFLMYAAFGISWMAYAPVLADLEAHFGVAHARAALIISLVSVSKAFVPLLAGLLAARIGLVRALALGAGLASVALVAPMAPSFETLLAARFVFGIGGAIIVTLMGSVAMEWFPAHELPLVNGLNNVAVNTGITVALFVTVPLAGWLGVQGALLALAAPSVLLCAAWLIVSAGTPPRRTATAAAGQSTVSLREIAARRETWLIALAFAGPLSLYLALNTWLPAHLMAVSGLDKLAASRATGLFNLVGIPSAIFGGWLTARLGLRRPVIIAAGLIMPLAALLVTTSPALRLAGSVLLGLSFFLATSPIFTIPTELPGITSRGVALLNGVVFSVSYVVSFFSPILVGYLHGRTGSYMPGFAIFIAGSGLTALAGLLLPETGPAARTREARSAQVPAVKELSGTPTLTGPDDAMVLTPASRAPHAA